MADIALRMSLHSLPFVGSKLVIQRFQTAAQRLGCAILVARPVCQGGFDQPALCLSERGANGYANAALAVVQGTMSPGRSVDVHRLQLHLLLADDERALDGVLELAHVSGPVVVAQSLQCARAEVLLGAVP